jgi:hypothetical protein
MNLQFKNKKQKEFKKQDCILSQSLMKTSATRNSQEKTATVLATSLRSQRSEAIILQLQD